jgi:hypothetical protein
VAAGNLVYNCIVNIPGVIAVDMMFMETWRSVVGSRLFNIKVQGSTVFTDVDIFNEAGYQTPLIKTSYVTLDTPGTITIEFVPRSGKEGPAVYGLELRVIGTVAPTSGAPSMPPTARPTHGFPLVTHRINCGGPSVTDTNGNVWVGDNAFAPGGDFVQPNKYVYLPLSQTTLGTPPHPHRQANQCSRARSYSHIAIVVTTLLGNLLTFFGQTSLSVWPHHVLTVQPSDTHLQLVGTLL